MRSEQDVEGFLPLVFEIVGVYWPARGVGHVEQVAERRSSGTGDGIHNSIDPRLGEVGHRDVGAFISEQVRGGAAHSRCRAGDKYNLVLDRATAGRETGHHGSNCSVVANRNSMR